MKSCIIVLEATLVYLQVAIDLEYIDAQQLRDSDLSPTIKAARNLPLKKVEDIIQNLGSTIDTYVQGPMLPGPGTASVTSVTHMGQKYSACIMALPAVQVCPVFNNQHIRHHTRTMHSTSF